MGVKFSGGRSREDVNILSSAIKSTETHHQRKEEAFSQCPSPVHFWPRHSSVHQTANVSVWALSLHLHFLFLHKIHSSDVLPKVF